MNFSVIEVLGSTVYLIPLMGPIYGFLEWKRPLNSEDRMRPTLRQVGQDLPWELVDHFGYPLTTGFVLSAIAFCSTYLGINLFRLVNGFTAILGPRFPITPSNAVFHFLLLFLARDFSYYFLHYCFHRNRFLWRFHILHHSSETINWVSNFRAYWLESVIADALSGWIGLFLRVPEKYIVIITIIGTQISYLSHANVRLSLGRLGKWINNPLAHHWHHAAECKHPFGQNFGNVLLIWDRIFGTYYLPESRLPPEVYGLSEPDRYPKTLLGRFIYPLRGLK